MPAAATLFAISHAATPMLFAITPLPADAISSPLSLFSHFVFDFHIAYYFAISLLFAFDYFH